MKKIITPIAVVLSSATNVLAAGGNDEGSGFMIWAFMGFCAIIVVGQAIPALLMMFGAAKGIASKEKKAETSASWGSE